MRVSVIIPTFKRVEFLAHAMRGLAAQQRPADQIVLGVRTGDSETLEAARSYPVETAEVQIPGVIASMSAAVARTTGDIVCLLDDDAEPPPDWIARIESLFEADSKLGIVGGRDLLQDRPEMRKAEPTTETVGLFTKYGRIIGNHHKGSGTLRHVHVVKGCNAAVRGPLLREIGFAQELRGKGAQVHWELALCLDIANRGYSVAYDPAVQVIHHIAPRHDNDLIHRGHFSAEGLYDMVWNEHRIVATRTGKARSTAHLAWSVLAGSLTAPGLMQYLRLTSRKDPHRNEKFSTTLRAIRDARKL